jgi:hypothetical protein
MNTRSVLDPNRKWWTRTSGQVVTTRATAARQAREEALHACREACAAYRREIADEVATAWDEEYQGWLPLLQRPRLPYYVTNAIPDRVWDRYEWEISGS